MTLEYIRLHNQLLKIMANKTLGMHKIRQILLFLKRDLSERSIAQQTGVSRPTIHSYRGIFETSGFDYDTLLKLNDAQLYELVKTKKKGPDLTPDVRNLYFLEQSDYFIAELRRVGVTRLLLSQEYLKEYPEGFNYSRFCELLDIQINLKSPKSDNLKQWVVRSCRYESNFPQALEQWALHNHIGLLTIRVRAPKDKPSVENQVKIVYRRIYAAIRNETFYSVQELNRKPIMI